MKIDIGKIAKIAAPILTLAATLLAGYGDREELKKMVSEEVKASKNQK